MLACVLALVLVMDVSGSVDHHGYAVQRDGTAAAISHPETGRLIERIGPVAMMAVEYGSTSHITVPWHIIRNSAEARAFGDRVGRTERSPDSGGTATGEAILFALEQLAQAPCMADQQVIDISTDGESNVGRNPQDARDQAIANEVRINGLAIRSPQGHGNPAEWIREHVITPGGFVIEVTEPSEYPDAMRRKLVLEITEAAGTRFAEIR